MGNDFEKHIRDSLNNPPDFPFDENLWEKMDQRLEKDQTPKSFWGRLGYLPMILLALSTSFLAGFYYHQHQGDLEKISVLETMLRNQVNGLANNAVEKRVTVIYDTIYKEVQGALRPVMNVFRPERLGVSFHRTAFNVNTSPWKSTYTNGHLSIGSIQSPEDWWLQQPARLSLGLSSRQEDPTTELINELAVSDYPNEPDISSIGKLGSLAALPSLGAPFLEFELLAELPPVIIEQQKRKKRLLFTLQKLKPTKFMLSGTTGTFVSLNLGTNGFNLRGSALAEVGLGDRLIFSLGTEYFSNDFNKRIEVEDEYSLDGFPELPRNNAEDELTYIQGDFNYWQIPIGFKYVVFPQRYFYPYLGAGIVASKTTRSRLEYTYESLNGEYSVSQGQLMPRKFLMNGFWAALGFRVQLNKHWSLLVEGGSQFDLDPGTYKYEDLQLLRLGAGFQYKF